MLQAALLRLTGPTRPTHALRWKPKSFFDPDEEVLECVPVGDESRSQVSRALDTIATSTKSYVRGSNNRKPFPPAGFGDSSLGNGNGNGNGKESIDEDEKLIREKLAELLETGDEGWFHERIKRWKEDQSRGDQDVFALGENEEGFLENLIPDDEMQRDLDRRRARVGLEQDEAYALGGNNGGAYLQLSMKQEGFSLASVFDGTREKQEDLYDMGEKKKRDKDPKQAVERHVKDKHVEEAHVQDEHVKENQEKKKHLKSLSPLEKDQESDDEDEVELSRILGDDAPFWDAFAKGKRTAKWRNTSPGEDHAFIDVTDVSDFPTLVPDPAIDYPFDLDLFQKRAVVRLERGESIFVAAHTSAGKTVVAEYAIALAARHKTKVVYTSPIKTLSNQKFRDFSDRFGDVGIITGDISMNPEAFCLVMTTEILRSMLYKGADLVRDIEWVIFDELHYLNDRDRGVVWEETIILLPEHVNFVMLSATVPNAKDFSLWVGRTKKRSIPVITTDRRPVPLQHSLFVSNELFPVLHSSTRVFQRMNYRSAKTKLMGDEKVQDSRVRRNHDWPRLVKYLRQRKLDPAIVFCFSKRKCEEAAQSLGSVDLVSNAVDRNCIHAFFEGAIKRLSPPDRAVPQILRHREMVKRGVGVHHSGILPIVKEITEVLFQGGLVRVLFATETFAMGVNMPARTVIFSSINKYSSQGRRRLEPGEYVQMAGRAGRRGLDSVGTVLLYFSSAEFPSELDLETVLNGRPKELRSQFRLTYNSILNLLRTASLRVEDIMTRSFSENEAKRGSDKPKKALASWRRRLAKFAEESPRLNRFRDYHEQLIRARILASKFYGDATVQAQKTLFASGRILVILRSDGALGLAAVITKSRRGPKLSLKRPGNESKGLVKGILLAGGSAVHGYTSPFLLQPKPSLDTQHTEYEAAGTVLHIGDLSADDILVATKSTIDISQRELNPIRGAPTPHSLISAAEALISFVEEHKATSTPALESLDPLRDLNIGSIELNETYGELRQRTWLMMEILQASPSLVEEGLKDGLADLTREMELKLKISRMEYGISEKSLQFMPDYQRRLAVLKQLGYVADSTPLSVLLKGRAACEVNACDSLILTELVFENHLGPLSSSDLAALLSCLVHQQKSEVSLEKELYMIQTVSEPLFIACEAVQRAMAGIAGAQAKQGLPVAVTEYVKGSTKLGMVVAVKAWAEGQTFVEVCELVPDIAEGTIVRCIVRLCELMRETKNLAKVVGNSELMEKAEEAIIKCKRDVIFAASLYVQ